MPSAAYTTIANALEWEGSDIDTSEAQMETPPAPAAVDVPTPPAPPEPAAPVDPASSSADEPADLTPADLDADVDAEVAVTQDEDLDEQITEAKLEVGDLTLAEKEAAASHAIAKKQLAAAVAQLQNLVFQRRGLRNGDDGDESQGDADAEGAGQETEPGEAPADNDESWRDVPVSVLRLSAPISAALLEANLGTIGALSVFLESKSLRDIRKVGEKKAELIQDALEKFWPRWRDGKIKAPAKSAPALPPTAAPTPKPAAAPVAAHVPPVKATPVKPTPVKPPKAAKAAPEVIEDPGADSPAYVEGAEAREAGKANRTNPYRQGTSQWRDWDRGWQDVHATSPADLED